MKFFSALLLVSCITFVGAYSNADDGTTVVATVNGINLTKAELDQEISKLVPMERAFHGGMSESKQSEIKKKGMGTLIDMELQYQDGLSKGYKLDKKTLERETDILAAKYPVREEYDEAVKKAGFTDNSMERFISRNIISKKIKEVEVDKKINVTDQMVAAHYQENKSKYMKPDEYRASTILIKVPSSALPEQREEFRKKADDLYLQLKKGADFADLASKYSDDMTRIKGGDLGYFHAGQSADPEFDVQIKKLKIGEVSSVVTSLQGFYIVKLTEVKPPRQLPFDELKDKIKMNLINSEKEKLYNDWMASLKKKAKISYPQEVKPVKG